MNKQEVFDRVVERMAAQGFKQSIKMVELQDGLAPECRYRGESGLRCAAGWLINDEHYRTAFEGTTADDPTIYKAICRSFELQDVPATFILELQHCHDSGVNPEEMKKLFRTFAQEEGLKIPESIE